MSIATVAFTLQCGSALADRVLEEVMVTAQKRSYITTGQAQIAGGVIFGTYNRPREWYLALHVRE